MTEEEITLAARTAYEAIRAYRNQIGMADTLPWIDAGAAKQNVFEQAVREVARGKQRPIVNIEEVLIKAVTAAINQWRKSENGDSTRATR